MTALARPHWASDLLELLDQQQSIYQRLGPLSEQQGRLVADGDTESLLSLLSQRQSLIDQLLAINRKLEPYRLRWPELWADLDESTRKQVKSRLDGVQRLLDAIITRDEQDRRALVERRQDVGRQIGHLQRGATVNRAYGKPADPPPAPRFTDEQG